MAASGAIALLWLRGTLRSLSVPFGEKGTGVGASYLPADTVCVRGVVCDVWFATCVEVISESMR